MSNLPTIKRGNTYRFTYLHMHNSVAANLTGATVVFTVKDEEGDDSTTDTTAIIQKTIVAHLTQSGDTLGKTVIECTPNETLLSRETTLPIAKGTYYFDIKIKHADGTQFTEEEGKVKVDIAPTNTIL